MALLFHAAQESPLVIPALNRDGDLLADLVLPLYGSIASAESLIVALDDGLAETAIVAEAAHGTAPALEGKNVANPLAMLLAIASLLERMPREGERAGTGRWTPRPGTPVRARPPWGCSYSPSNRACSGPDSPSAWGNTSNV